jgi:hypothetical protein
MRFQIRDLVWATAFVGLIIARFIDQEKTRERELVIERLAHKIDADVHDHLKTVSRKLYDLEGWGNSIDRRLDEDGRRGVAIDATLAELITDKIRREQQAQQAAKRSK